VNLDIFSTKQVTRTTHEPPHNRTHEGNTRPNHLAAIGGCATTVRATSHAWVGGRAEVSMGRRNTRPNHLAAIGGCATTVRATSHAWVGGRAEVSMGRRNTRPNHLAAIGGCATTVRATSHAWVGGRAEVSIDIFKGAPLRLPKLLSDQFCVRVWARMTFVYKPSVNHGSA